MNLYEPVKQVLSRLLYTEDYSDSEIPIHSHIEHLPEFKKDKSRALTEPCPLETFETD